MRRDDFSIETRRTLAQRAGFNCANPDCGRPTSWPSDDATGRSTRLGKACHITAASPDGPRYDPALSSAQRSHADNGIWLCSECADRVDKNENEPAYPVELLRHWKDFHESTTGTDHASRENRRRYPLRRLDIVDFAGVRGEARLRFGALTIVAGTSKLSHTIGELIRIFSLPEVFNRTGQPSGRGSWEIDRFDLGDGLALVATGQMNPPRTFAEQGKLRLILADTRQFVMTIRNTGAALYLNDAPIPVFSPVVRTVSTGPSNSLSADRSQGADEPAIVRGSRYFGMTPQELRRAIEGRASDQSLFDYGYRFDDEGDLEARTGPSNPYLPVDSLSRGEQCRLILDVASRAASYAATIAPTVLLVEENDLGTLDSRGWATFLEWVEAEQPPFQTVVDLVSSPTEGELHHALCYQVVGEDMEVTALNLKTWRDFRGEVRRR